MAKFYREVILVAFILPLIVLSCKIEEIAPPDPDLRPASTVVINEVFTLPLNHQNTFWWIEFYNPTPNMVDLTNWTLSLTTLRLNHFRIFAGRIDTTILRDSTIRKIDSLVVDSTVTVDTLRVISVNRVGFDSLSLDSGIFEIFDVPFAEGVYDPRLYDIPVENVVRVVLSPGRLLTIYNNEARLTEYTELGPGPGVRQQRQLLLGSVDSAVTLRHTRDTVISSGTRIRRDTVRVGSDTTFTIIDTTRTITIIDTVRYRAKAYAFVIHPKDQLVLKDSAGNIVDVVRMGDSTYTNVIGGVTYDHPLLSSSNRSIGTVPEFESIARFARGYFTGNTANDFYITRRPYIVPIPHGGSTFYKGR